MQEQEHYLECQCDITDGNDNRCHNLATREVFDTKLAEFLKLCEGHYQSLYVGTDAVVTDIKPNSN